MSKPRLRIKKREVEFSIFSGYTVYIIATNDIARAALRFKQTKNTDIGTDTQAICVHEVDNGITYMFLPFTSDAGDVAHECWHVVKRMLEYVGAELENEVVAYHLGFLVRQAHKTLNQ